MASETLALRGKPEEHFRLHGLDQIAKPGVAYARAAAVELGRDRSLIVQWGKLILVHGDSHQNRVAFVTAIRLDAQRVCRPTA